MPVSLILDALNRAREDVHSVPGLGTHHRVEPVAASRWQYLLWVALSVAVVVIAWLIVERYSAPRSVEDDVVVSVVQSSSSDAVDALVGSNATTQAAATIETVPQTVVEPTPPVATSVTPAPQQQDLPAAAASSARMDTPEQLQADPSAMPSLDATASAVQSGPAAEPMPEPVPLQSQSPEEDFAVAELYSNPPPNEEPVTQRDTQSNTRQNDAARDSGDASGDQQSIDIDRILREAREEVENASLPDHPVPFLIDLSQQTKDSIPTVYYLRHDYSSNSSLSTVVLNSKTLGVGGSPVPGMKIEEILSDSVVLNYQGTQFRLRALNSWVNL